MSLQGFYEWMKLQGQYALFIALIVLFVVTAAKRAWIAMIGALVGLTFVGIFIINPKIIIALAQWLGGLLDIGFIGIF